MASILHNDWTNRARPRLGWKPDLSHPLMAGCVLEMPLGIEGAGGVITDYSISRNRGTLSGTGRKWGDSNGLKLNGSDDYIDLGTGTGLSTFSNATFSCIIQTPTNQANKSIFWKGPYGVNAESDYNLTTATNSFYWNYTNAAGLNSSIGGGYVFSTNKPISIIITMRDTELAGNSKTLFRMFINGVMRYSGSYSDIRSTSSPFSIGYSYITAARYWLGNISLARVHNWAMSSDEVKSLSQNPWQAWRPAINRTYFAPLLLFGGVDPLYMSFAMTGGSDMSATLRRRREIGASLTGSGALAVTTQRKLDFQVALTGSSAFSFRIADYVDYRIPFNIRRSVVRSSLRAPIGKSLLRVPVLKSNLKAVKI